MAVDLTLGCDGAQPSRLPTIVVTTGRPLLADLLEDVRSVGAAERCQSAPGNGCEGPQPSKGPSLALRIHQIDVGPCKDSAGLEIVSPSMSPMS